MVSFKSSKWIRTILQDTVVQSDFPKVHFLNSFWGKCVCLHICNDKHYSKIKGNCVHSCNYKLPRLSWFFTVIWALKLGHRKRNWKWSAMTSHTIWQGLCLGRVHSCCVRFDISWAVNAAHVTSTLSWQPVLCHVGGVMCCHCGACSDKYVIFVHVVSYLMYHELSLRPASRQLCHDNPCCIMMDVSCDVIVAHVTSTLSWYHMLCQVDSVMCCHCGLCFFNTVISVHVVSYLMCHVMSLWPTSRQLCYDITCCVKLTVSFAVIAIYVTSTLWRQSVMCHVLSLWPTSRKLISKGVMSQQVVSHVWVCWIVGNYVIFNMILTWHLSCVSDLVMFVTYLSYEA